MESCVTLNFLPMLHVAGFYSEIRVNCAACSKLNAIRVCTPLLGAKLTEKYQARDNPRYRRILWSVEGGDICQHACPGAELHAKVGFETDVVVFML